jgi:hypothetical protein
MTSPDRSAADALASSEEPEALPACEDCADAGRCRRAHDVDTVRDRFVCRPCEVASWALCTRCKTPESPLPGGLCYECRHPEGTEEDEHEHEEPYDWWPDAAFW